MMMGGRLEVKTEEDIFKAKKTNNNVMHVFFLRSFFI